MMSHYNLRKRPTPSTESSTSTKKRKPLNPSQKVKSLELQSQTRGTTSQKDPKKQRMESIEKCIKFLVHATQCKLAYCKQPSCIKMKRVLTHISECRLMKLGRWNLCHVCKNFVLLCISHAKTCQKKDCPVPVCNRVKRNMRDMRNQRRVQAMHQRMAQINNASSSAANPQAVDESSLTYQDSSLNINFPPHHQSSPSVATDAAHSLRTSETQPEKIQADKKSNFSSDITWAIAKKQKIERKIAHILLKGLPGSGKTTLLDRLLNMPLREWYSSTGMCEGTVTVEVGPSSTHTSCYTCDDNTWTVTDFDESIVSQLDSCKQVASHSSREDIDDFLQNYEGGLSELVSDFECHVKEVLGKHNIKNIVDLQTKCSLYIRDTGGQVEFQESLSLLIFGPSIFIFVLRTDIDIHTDSTIQYRLATGEISNKYTSSISTMDALIQFLTSVSAIQTTEEGVFEVDGTSVCHKPVVFIVGTHIDKLGSEPQSVLDNINKVLHETISKWKFSHIISYADGHLNKVMYEVNNLDDEDAKFQNLRYDISRYICCKSEFSVEYPVSYLLFCLELQNVKEAVMSMDNCKRLAAKYNIEESEIGSLLHFLHFRVGIIQHYNVEGISNVIIKEPQVLFDKVTELILNTFLLNSTLPKAQQKCFCERGILELSAFKDVLNENDQITSEQFLLFLLHLRIAVSFTDKMGVHKYFIPSVLNHVPKSPSDAVNSNIDSLAITFQLGHCPKGLFGMMITYLLNPEVRQELTFDLSEDHIYQDQVSLLVNSSEDVDMRMNYLFTILLSAPAFTLKNLTILKWTDKDGRPQTLRLRDDISCHWCEVGDLLELDSSRIKGIAIHRRDDVRQCCRDVLQYWLRKGSPDYPATWEGMLKLLEDIQISSNSLKSALDFFQN